MISSTARRRSTLKAVIGLAATTAMIFALSGCATRGGAQADSESGGVKQGIGVTGKTITLGALTDLSGPVKAQGFAATAGNVLWADQVNAAGGVCKRDIKIIQADHGYNADTAVTIYPALQQKTLGMVQLLGGSVVSALQASLSQDKVTATAASFSSQLLGQKNVVVLGTTYDLEMINLLAYGDTQAKLKAGDKIGQIYLDGEFGGNALRGAQYFADQRGVELDAVKVAATDTDMTSIVSKLKSDGVKMLALSVPSGASASALSAANSLGLNVPIVASNVAFDPSMFSSPAAPLLSKLIVGGSLAPIGSDVPAAKKLLAVYTAKYKEAPSTSIVDGFATGLVWQKILERACKDGNLTRDGVTKALAETTEVSTEGLTGDLHFVDPGSPNSRASFIEKPDSSVPGGLVLLKSDYQSPEATSYVAPNQK